LSVRSTKHEIIQSVVISVIATRMIMSNDDRLNRMDDQLIDMRLAVSALLETVTHTNLHSKL
jgi:hypothetical protein